MQNISITNVANELTAVLADFQVLCKAESSHIYVFHTHTDAKNELETPKHILIIL